MTIANIKVTVPQWATHFIEVSHNEPSREKPMPISFLKAELEATVRYNYYTKHIWFIKAK